MIFIIFIFENLVINEFIKASIHRGEQPKTYFWQDNQGKEIDCLLVDGEKALPIEIKAGKTMSNSYFTNLQYWRKLAGAPDDYGHVVYGGEQTLKTSYGQFTSWRDLETLEISKGKSLSL